LKIIAVTGCPYGQVFTYMAAVALEKAAEELGHEIKIEMQGANVIGNKIEAQDMIDADFVIFATDLPVKEEARFYDNFIFRIQLQKAIRDPGLLLTEAVRNYLEKTEYK
jgi:fructose-specific PTS system IIB-like component